MDISKLPNNISQPEEDMLSTEDIMYLLEDYVKADVKELKRFTPVRYFYLNDDKKTYSFKMGGNIFVIDKKYEYVILSNGKAKWSVQTKDAIFYQKMSINAIKEEFNEILFMKDENIKHIKSYASKLEKDVEQLNNKLEKSESEIKKMYTYIQQLENKLKIKKK